MPSISGKTIPKSNLPTEIQCVDGIWTGGGAAANCTRNSADHSLGITSVNYNGATGRYRITVTEWGQQLLPDSHVEIHRASTGAPRVANLIRTITAGTNTATIDFEVWDLATPSGADLLTTDKVAIHLVFAKTKPTS